MTKLHIASSLRSTVIALGIGLVLAATPAFAQSQNSAPAADNPASAHNWTTDQIMTATVHQAWILSGKDENTFFEIVRELTEISAHNRNLVLPDDPAAGRRAGDYIKAQAKADHDELLYNIVDKSVRMTGKPAPAAASTH